MLLAEYRDRDRSAYLIRQLRFWVIQHRQKDHNGCGNCAAGLAFCRPSRDWVTMMASVFDAEVWRRLVRWFSSKSANEVQTLWPGLERLDDISTIRQFSDWLGKAPGQSKA